MLGDGIRRDIATISDEERTLFINAIKSLDDPTSSFVYGNNAGNEAADASGNITYWDMQEQIHKDGHAHGVDVHFGPAFIPWHRSLINHFEKLLREVDPRLSLHYWDWTTDPRTTIGDRVDLFTTSFMGSATGNAGSPLQDFESTEITGDPAEGIPGDGVHDHIWRDVAATAANPDGTPALDPDTTILMHGDFTSFAASLKAAHDDTAHSYIGGTLTNPHFSFHDPFVFLLHSNLDRIWAMWQRAPGHQERLDPAHAYGTIATDLGLPGNYFDELAQPWAGVDLTGTLQTGLNPWKGDPSKREPVPYNDPSIVIPASYDTAPHSSYVVFNQDTFSTSQVAVQQTFPAAFLLNYEGFEPKELGVTGSPAPTAPPNAPSFSFKTGGAALQTISAINPVMRLEDPLGAIDVPQRITVQYDLHFTGAGEFPSTSGGEVIVEMTAALNYQMDTGTGGTVIDLTEAAKAPLTLVNQPNPYMLKVDPTVTPPNPYWLSMDTRVFRVKTGGTIGAGPGAPTQGDVNAAHPHAANDFIQAVVANFNSLPNDVSHPFLTQLTADETGSTLYLPGQEGGVNVYNYAVAKVRYLAPAGVPATGVSLFFRVFSTMVSGLDYDAVAASTGNYRRSGNAAGAVPLLGVESSEVASIPFFAAPRVNTVAGTAGAASMTTQVDDASTNTHTLVGAGTIEQVAYFGCWLDINQTDLRFPRNPLADPGGVDGPYVGSAPGNPLLSIQQLMNGFHQCLVAEIFFWPPGTASDPIAPHATPSSSDRLAQRNLALVPSSNPGWPDAHLVQHTFLVKASPVTPEAPLALAPASRTKRGRQRGAEQSVIRHRAGPDELMIDWQNVPRASYVQIFLPEVLADDILGLNALRQHPSVLTKIDEHTLAVEVADVTFIPLPPARNPNMAGLLSLTLPPTVRTGQVFRVAAQQVSGTRNRVLGGFQLTIPVRTDPEILPAELDKLAVLRHIQLAIPPTNRWHEVFKRYVAGVVGRVRGLGGDPTGIEPSPYGAGRPAAPCEPERGKPCEPCAQDLWRLNIPWDDCEVDGEIELKLRFRKRCE